MNWVIWVLILLAVVFLAVIIYFFYKKKLGKDEKGLVKFLKKNNGEADPRFLKIKMKVSRAWLEDVAGRLEKKGKVVRWGWRKKSLICLKGAVVKNEKKVVKLLKKNGGIMAEAEVARRLGFDKESFYWRMVRKLEEKGVVWVKVEGKRNFLVLGEGNIVHGLHGLRGYEGRGAAAKLDKSEERLVKILRKSGGEMLDRNLALRVRDARGIISGLIRKGVVFRWGAKKKNVCLKDMLSKDEERLVRIVKENDGRMMWRELVKKMKYCGKGFHRVLDKLEIKGFIVRRKVGRSVEIILIE